MSGTYKVEMPGAILQRGFWLYVWQVETPNGDVLYVGRTGDNSSPHATAPFSRMGQHLGQLQNQNALRRHLERRGIDPKDCSRFTLISHGPLYSEVDKASGVDREALMKLHIPIRNIVGAMEKRLADVLNASGYDVLNKVSWFHVLPDELWAPVEAAFAEHFSDIRAACRAVALGTV